MAPIAVILAAGQSKRMKSAVPKVLHDVCGRPMIDYVLDAARQAGAKRLIVVVGHRAEMVRERLSAHTDVEFALQAEQKGTGHAVMMCEDQLKPHDGPALVLAGDTPLLRSESLLALLEELRTQRAACVIGTTVTEANEGLGRIVRDAAGRFLRIVEQKDATPAEAAIREINTGCYAFDCQSLLSVLGRLRANNTQGEFYLTDCPALLSADGRTVLAISQFDIREAMGVNTRGQLAAVSRAFVEKHMDALMAEGVTIVSPERTWIEPRASVGRETVIHPFSTITGPAVIGENCTIGPHAVIIGPVEIPAGTTVRSGQHG